MGISFLLLDLAIYIFVTAYFSNCRGAGVGVIDPGLRFVDWLIGWDLIILRLWSIVRVGTICGIVVSLIFSGAVWDWVWD